MTDVQQDMNARWLPSPEQRADAEKVLRAGWPEAYTVQVLHNKRYALWTTEVAVVCPRGVFPDRESASTFAQALVVQVRAEGGTATASYAHHFLYGDREEAAVFEDILTWESK